MAKEVGGIIKGVSDKIYFAVERDLSIAFNSRKTCERCHEPFNNGKIVSIFNLQCICMICKEVEKTHPLYKKAVEVDKYFARKGTVYFGGMGVDLLELKKLRKEYLEQK